MEREADTRQALVRFLGGMFEEAPDGKSKTIHKFWNHSHIDRSLNLFFGGHSPSAGRDAGA
jgi:hypothetical protein